jgi:hypothetical protein
MIAICLFWAMCNELLPAGVPACRVAALGDKTLWPARTRRLLSRAAVKVRFPAFARSFFFFILKNFPSVPIESDLTRVRHDNSTQRTGDRVSTVRVWIMRPARTFASLSKEQSVPGCFRPIATKPSTYQQNDSANHAWTVQSSSK